MKKYENNLISSQRIDIIFFCIGIISYIFLSAKLNIWVDEALTLQATERTLPDMLNWLQYLEKQPPAYYLLLKLWRSINGSIFFARLFSLIFTFATLIISNEIYGTIVGTKSKKPILAFMISSPLIVYTAVEIRQYSFVLFLSSLILFLFVKGYLLADHNKRYIYIFVAIISLYTNYFLGFLLLSYGVLLIVLRRYKVAWEYIIHMFIVGILFVPMLFVLKIQLQSHSDIVNHANNHLSFLAGIKFFYWRVLEYLIPWKLNNFGTTIKSLYSLFSKLLIFLLSIIFFVNIKKFRKNQLAIFLLTFLIIFTFILLRNIIGLSFLQPHHTEILFIPLLLSFLILLSKLNKKIFYPLFTIILIFNITSTLYSYSKLSKFGDWKNVAEFIIKNENTGEPIFFFRMGGILPFRRYYNGVNQLITIPRNINPADYAIDSAAIINEKQLITCLNSTNLAYKKFWIVTYGIDSYLGVNFNAEILENFFQKHCHTIKTRLFNGSKIRLMAVTKEF